MYTAARLVSTGRAAVFLRVRPREYPFRLAASRQATFPKGTAFVVAIKFSAQPKGVPLGELAANAVSRLRGYPPRGCFRRKQARQLPFPAASPPVKMRLERSAERDKREI